MRLLLSLLLIPVLGVQSRVFFPEELVSFLSFVYSVIPPFKIGQDSRIGAGFRVGPNADFQILLELGPQSETQPLGPDGAGTRDTRAPALPITPGVNRRKSLKGRKHIFVAKDKNTSEPQVESNNFRESSTVESNNFRESSTVESNNFRESSTVESNNFRESSSTVESNNFRESSTVESNNFRESSTDTIVKNITENKIEVQTEKMTEST